MAYEPLSLVPLFNAFIFFIIIISIWELIWKSIALWKSARNKQLIWFIVLLIFNTAGILPILYILFFQKNRELVKKKKS